MALEVASVGVRCVGVEMIYPFKTLGYWVLILHPYVGLILLCGY